MQNLIPMKRNQRTVVHAGPMLLDEEHGSDALETYLARPRERELFLVHDGRPVLRKVAQEAGVADIKMRASEDAPQAEKAADLAVALGAEDLEYMIDRPALKNVVGSFIREITLHEAESYACDPTLRQSIRRKIWAGCTALRRGVDRVRIGNPISLARGRATVIVHDTPFALGAELNGPPDADRDSDSDSDRTPTPDPERHPLEMPGDERPPKKLARHPSRTKRLRFSPRYGCEMGPPSPYPFPDAPFFSRMPMDRRGERPTRRTRRARA